MSDKDTHESDVTFIRALAELLRSNDLTELEVKREYGDNDRLNVRVSRGGTVVMQAALDDIDARLIAQGRFKSCPNPFYAGQTREPAVA